MELLVGWKRGIKLAEEGKRKNFFLHLVLEMKNNTFEPTNNNKQQERRRKQTNIHTYKKAFHPLLPF